MRGSARRSRAVSVPRIPGKTALHCLRCMSDTNMLANQRSSLLNDKKRHIKAKVVVVVEWKGKSYLRMRMQMDRGSCKDTFQACNCWMIPITPYLFGSSVNLFSYKSALNSVRNLITLFFQSLWRLSGRQCDDYGIPLLL